MKKFRLIVSLLLMTAFVMSSMPVPKAEAASAANFQAGRIIDDSTFTNQNSMTISSIQAFLESKVSDCDAGHTCLKNFSENGKSAAQIIWEQSRDLGINPQVLIVLLQKEQGLVTSTDPGNYEYTYATGFCVPDGTPPPQCEGTYGFTNQLYYAARMFRRIMNDDSRQYTPFLLGNNNIPYSVGCAGPTVFIQNRATLALYSYTPYQPNAAVLEYLYGVVPDGHPGRSCAAYGNRNFWRNFNDWFGPSTGEGFTLMSSSNDNGDLRQWVVYKGLKRHIPSAEVLRAWGLDRVPLAQTSGQYLGSITTAGQPLDRLFRPSGSLDVYFADSGNCYKIMSQEMMNNWGLNPAGIVDVSVDLGQLLVNKGHLPNTFRKHGSLAVYMMDGGNTIRQYGDGNIMAAWEGDDPKIIDLSQDYSAKLSNVGSMISSAKAKSPSSDTQYNVVSGQKLVLSPAVSQLYPGTPTTVSEATIARLVPSVAASQFIRAAGSGTIYMVNNGSKHAVGSPDLVRAWGKGANPEVNVVTQGNVNLLTTGSPLSTFQADVGGQLYLMDGRKLPVPSSLDSAYRSGSVFAASSALLSLSADGETPTAFLKSFQNPAVYLMDNNSAKLLASPTALDAWSNGQPITNVSSYVINQFPKNGLIGVYVWDGTNEYVVESGARHGVSPTAKTNWSLNTPALLNAATINRLGNGSALPDNDARDGSKYFLIHEGSAYMTTDINIADAWSVDDAPSLKAAVIDDLLSLKTMTRHAKAKSSGDSRLFIVDSGTLHHLSPEHAGNLGLAGTPMAVNPEAITPTIDPWPAVIVKDSSGKAYVIDGGTKRPFPSLTVQNFWTNNGAVSVPQVTNGFLNLLPTAGIVERAIKGSGPNIYAAQANSKRWIQSGSTYSTAYAPYAQVSNTLLGSLPSGTAIP